MQCDDTCSPFFGLSRLNKLACAIIVSYKKTSQESTLQEKYGYPKLSRLEKLGINSQKLP